ncbi:stage II sporulation protein P [Alkalicoccobacillus porphyridii]|uniref:Stage II sporulation protein P n=1 Tax=Alkalicoccobacillus porphyridii TaxID=2597270 RepID=A0A553ZZB5_9BACI|nr:stage II sporulation protein P [Alkalicoccobacillus porphyridii]TSB46779.1 stage II sporulation protein P [Alkalicoccobacillus porphyridii]
MRSSHFGGMTIRVNRTSIKQLLIKSVVGVISLFILVSILTSVGQGRGLSSQYIHSWSTALAGEQLLQVMGMENTHFSAPLPVENRQMKLAPLAFQLVTSLNPEDPRSFLGRELPGFAFFDSQIYIAGEGTDYTTLSHESSPPMDVQLAEQEAKQESLEKVIQLEKEAEEAKQQQGQSEQNTGDKKVVYLINTHDTESFLPELNSEEAFNNKVNITQTSEKLRQELERRGIGASLEERSVQEHLKSKGWNYNRSYDAARDFLLEAVEGTNDFELFFDLHRDSSSRNKTTVTINGEDYARTFFVVGGNNPNAQSNTKLAEDLNELLEERYPGLSRGVLTKEGSKTNGVFNQDLAPQSMLIEVGGVENTLEETYRSSEALADVIAEYYWSLQEGDS